MTRIRAALIAALVLAAVTPAGAQTNTGARPSPPPPPPLPPLTNIERYGPPPPHERPWPPPRSEVAPPMERTPPVAPLAPRVGN